MFSSAPGPYTLKPGFHIIVRIVPVVSKNVQTIGTIIWRRYPDDRKRPGRFKIHPFVPIVRIELNCIQAIEVVSVVRVVFRMIVDWTGTIGTIIWKPGLIMSPDENNKSKMNLKICKAVISARRLVAGLFTAT